MRYGVLVRLEPRHMVDMAPILSGFYSGSYFWKITSTELLELKDTSQLEEERKSITTTSVNRKVGGYYMVRLGMCRLHTLASNLGCHYNEWRIISQRFRGDRGERGGGAVVTMGYERDSYPRMHNSAIGADLKG